MERVKGSELETRVVTAPLLLVHREGPEKVEVILMDGEIDAHAELVGQLLNLIAKRHHMSVAELVLRALIEVPPEKIEAPGAAGTVQ